MVSFVAEIGLALCLVVKGVPVADADTRLPGDKPRVDLQPHGIH